MIEIRLVVEASLTAKQEDDLRQIIQTALAHPFEIRFTYFPDKIPPGSNGKFEEFVCRVTERPKG
ncbi:MAG: hypothetical protein EXQ98_05800 [Alphaproteobacteria bacterium]|nr:hypothetical protein [Alphaproteobacteria bacterium]